MDESTSRTLKRISETVKIHDLKALVVNIREIFEGKCLPYSVLYCCDIFEGKHFQLVDMLLR